MPDWLKRYAWFWGAASLLLGAAAIAIAIALRSEDPLDTADKLSSIGSLVIGAAGLIFGILSFAVALRGSTPQTDDAWAVAATANLATQVQRQWRGEQHLRRLHGSDLLRISWTSTTREVAASPADVLAGVISGGRPTKLRLKGTIDGAGSLYTRLPHHRLIVLGEPGAGKSVLAMSLTLQLLERRAPDHPVPVLLVLSTWDTDEDFESWVVRRLAEEYPSVTPMPKGATTGYRDLLRRGRIVPILDGLDELPDDLHVRALKALSLAAAQGQAFVLTCRSSEYAALVEHTGRPVPGAAVVEITPLTTLAVTSYLEGGRWSEVRDALKSGSKAHAALAHALQTPLMLHLARTMYARPGANPAELLDMTRFATSEAIQDHLLKSYLPAVYDTQPLPPPERPRRWRLRQSLGTAIARLTYLAQHGGESVSWWNLHEAVQEWQARSAALAGVALVVTLKLLHLLAGDSLMDIGSGKVVPIALIVGFIWPMSPVSHDPALRLPLPRSVVSAGLPVAIAVLLIDAL